MRYSVTLSYSGADFCGWQKQPGAPSVQETLENALGTLTGQPVAVVGAGRTDTGVGAVGYVAHFEVPAELDAQWLCCKLNAILPHQIAVQKVMPATPEFHARFDATMREYTYFLHRRKDPFAQGWSYLYGYPGLDFGLMDRAAALLAGTHDFSSFQKKGSDNRTTICTVFEAGWHPYVPTHVSILGHSDSLYGQFPEGGVSSGKSRDFERYFPSDTPPSGKQSDYWYFRISADRFLRNMVRAIVGTLLEVGRGRRTLEGFAELIGGGSRSDAGESAPGHALFLSRIEYPEK